MVGSSAITDVYPEGTISPPLKAALRAITLVMLVTMLVVWGLSLPPIYEDMTTPCQLDCSAGRLTTTDFAELEASNISSELYGALNIVLETAIVLPYGACCLLLLWRFSDNWAGWFASLIFAGAPYIGNAGAYGFEQLQPSALADLLNAIFNNLFALALLIFAYIFPSGSFYPRYLLWPILIFSGAMAIAGGSNMFSGEYAEWSQALTLIWIALFISGIFFQFRRYRKTTSEVTRLQMRWVGFGIAMVGVSLMMYMVIIVWWAHQPDAPRSFLHVSYLFIFIVTILPFPITVTSAILKYRLWNIDIIINRTLVYGALTAIVIGIYIVVVGGFGALFEASSSQLFSLIATGVVAISFHNLRDRVQRRVNRLMFGQRDEPQKILLNLSQRLQSAIMPEDLLRVSTETIGSSLRVPYVAIAIRYGEDLLTQAEYGRNGTPSHSFALVHQNEAVGELIVGRRWPGEALNSADQAVLSSVAQQMGAVVYAVRLQSELRTARERLVIAREEERRRLRRDLHDGLGPALASQPLNIDAAMELIADDQDAALKIMVNLKKQAQVLISDIRRVIHDLRPPALDELGLLEALRIAIAQVRTTQAGLRIGIDAETVLPELSAAVEVAAYRITMEAVTNVIKHARAANCWIKLNLQQRPPQLHIQVEDDGIGLPTPVVPNVGLQSMRERAEELGGTFQIVSRPTGGTRITVTLPILQTGVTS